MARVVVVCSAKGGVGKTTTAVNVAALFAETLRVLLIDSDPQDAGSASWWVADPSLWSVTIVEETDPARLVELCETHRHDLIVVDTPPQANSPAVAALANIADLFVCTAPPEGAEIVSALQTMQAFVDRRKAYVLLTMVDVRSMNEATEALAALEAAGVPCFRSIVRLYKAHRRARAQFLPVSQTVGEMASESAIDYRQVTAEIARVLATQLHPVAAASG
ncbi:MAG TPA: ParA family protein [Acidimicrobiales bacterium]|nr:ParA family protein [Acidimicrobiales bacterium]